MPPDGHGLTLLPLLAGERAPGWRGGILGALSGLALTTTPLEILQAAMEGVALRLAAVAARLAPLAAPGAPVVASGGAALGSAVWRRVIADALGRRVVASGEPEASARGAALLALRESGLLRSFDLAPARLGPAVDPDPARHARYRAALERQAALDARLFGA
jgi:gluconokinase